MHPIVLGLWPMAGITSGDVSREDGLATIQAAIDAGIDTIDTAYSYGYDGQSDRLLGDVLARATNQNVSLSIIGKVGQRWNNCKQRVIDGSPDQLTQDAEESLRRIGVDCFDLLMLHAVDPKVEIERSAEAVHSLRKRGLAKQVGVCNVTAEELNRFCRVGPCTAMQCPLNLLQTSTLSPLISTAIELNVQSHVYWTLMKGLLAGKISRDHQFGPGDSRPKYDIFQGRAYELAQDVVDRLRKIADECQSTVAKLAIGWALAQRGVTAVLAGAKKPAQIEETVAATTLSGDLLFEVEQAALPYRQYVAEQLSKDAC